MSQTSPLDPFRTMIEQGVDDGEIAKMAEVSVVAVRKYKAQMVIDAKTAAKAPEDSEAPEVSLSPAAAAIAAATSVLDNGKPSVAPAIIDVAPNALVATVRRMVEKYPDTLVVRLTEGFTITMPSPRTGKMASYPVAKSDYKGAMAVHIAKLCVEYKHTDELLVMDPGSPEYPPNPV